MQILLKFMVRYRIIFLVAVDVESKNISKYSKNFI